LLPVARCVVAEEDRGVRFAEAVAVPACAGPEARLLAFLGRCEPFPGSLPDSFPDSLTE
jgi:hypothetical protein